MLSAIISLLIKSGFWILLILSSINFSLAENILTESLPAAIANKNTNKNIDKDLNKDRDTQSLEKSPLAQNPLTENLSKVYFRTLQQYYLKTIATTFNTPQFYENFTALDQFINSPQFSKVDFSGNEQAYFTWMMDYAYWLILQSNQMPQKEARLYKLKAHKHLRALLAPETLSHDIQLSDTIPASFYNLDESFLTTIPPIYFYLLHKAGTYHHYANHIFLDDLRFYCYTSLLQNQKIPYKIQQDLAFFLNIETPSLQNCTPHIFLLNAVKKGQYQTMIQLLSQGIPIDRASYYIEEKQAPRYDADYSPLVAAIRNNDLKATTILLENGADLSINYGKDAKQNVMEYALTQQLLAYRASNYAQFNTDLMDLLLDYNADINASSTYSYLLAYALNHQESDDTVLRYLLMKGADPNREIEEEKDIPLYIALHQATYPEHYTHKQNSVKILIEEGNANINRTYIRRYIQPKGSEQAYPEYVTPIYHFLQKITQQENISKQTLQTLEYLLRSGADLTMGGICTPKMNCDELNDGWNEILKVIQKIPSQPVKCLINEYRPKNIVPESLFSFCES